MGSEDIYWNNDLFFAVETLNMRDLLPFPLDAIDTSYKGVMVVTLFLPTMAPKTSLVVLVLFAGLALVG